MAMTLHTLIKGTLKLDCTSENDLKEKEQKIIILNILNSDDEESEQAILLATVIKKKIKNVCSLHKSK